MFNKVGEFLSSFPGAMFMAVFSFICLLGELDSGWAWVYGGLTVYWLFGAWRAKNRGSMEQLTDDLTDDQKARIKDATQAFHAVLQEIDDEMQAKAKEDKAEALAKVLKDKEKK